MARFGVDPLAAWLNEQLGIHVVGHTPVKGGCIHKAWCLQTSGGKRLFAKTNRADKLPLLEAEADGLSALAKVRPPILMIPEPLALGRVGEQAVLVLPWLDFGSGAKPPEAWAEFGANLARLHRLSLHGSRGIEARGFGWERDNFIGSSPQPNGWRGHWSTFFAECRLRPQLLWLERKGVSLKGAERLMERLPEWLEPHGAQPCMVHGDLWSGNGSVLSGGEGCLFDPAVYFGDRETDLAMARLFGGFPEIFFVGYQNEWPLPDGWKERELIYQLYHLLNHANLFGGGYNKQAQSVIGTLVGLR